MELSRMGRALTTAVIFVFAGCGGAGTTVPLGAMPHSRAHQASSSSGDLLYVSVGHDILIFSYPSAELVGSLTGFNGDPVVECSDNDGSIFIAQSRALNTVEYAHGGSSPINTFDAIGGCSVDAKNDLAIVNQDTVHIYRSEQGIPKTYYQSGGEFDFCTYDGGGHLFLDTPHAIFSRLNPRTGVFTTITFNQHIQNFDDLHWDGKYVTIDDFGIRTPRLVHRVQISGSTGTVVSTTRLKSARLFGTITWLGDGAFVAPIWHGRRPKEVGFWRYPQGGRPDTRMPQSDFDANGVITGLAVSIAPSDAHIHK